jgi:hypothetical protein
VFPVTPAISMQDMMLGELERVIGEAGLTVVRDARWSNTGVLRATRGVDTILAVSYGIFDGYGTFYLAGQAVTQASDRFLTAQHGLARNRVCQGGVPLPYNQPLSPAVLTDRTRLEIRFHYLRTDDGAEIRELLNVVTELLGPGDMIIKFSVTHWYEIPVRSDDLNEITGGLQADSLRGPVEDGFEDEDTEEDVGTWLTGLAGQNTPVATDGIEIGSVVPRSPQPTSRP